MFNPQSPYTVYCNDCWNSDAWDPYSYGKDYDFNRPFFEQLGELVHSVPKFATYSSAMSGPNINSEYANFAGGNKDCYLVFNCGPNNENCAYSRGLMGARDTFDSYYGEEIERVYEGVSVHKSTGIVWGENVIDSLDSWFLINCSGCTNCFGCVNVRHKSYCFLNEQLTKEEWKRRVSEIIGSYEKMQVFLKEFRTFSLKFPRRENNTLKVEHCTGNYIFESKDCRNCFEVSFCENIKHAFSVKRAKDCYDVIGHCRNSELLLENVGVGASSSRVIGSWGVEASHDVAYSFLVRSSQYCFGSDSLRKAKYAVLNKRYTEEEYEKLRTHIIKELLDKDMYGLFLPKELAFFGYNETIGQDNMPLTKEAAIAEGFRWEEDIPAMKGQETITWERIADRIEDTPETILNEILACMQCRRNYRLIRSELEFYRRMLIPIPRKCWNCRFGDRICRRGPMKLFDRTCDHCKKPIKTNFAPDRPEIVYCESCYQREVI
jgi:hypothetical protein